MVVNININCITWRFTIVNININILFSLSYFNLSPFLSHLDFLSLLLSHYVSFLFGSDLEILSMAHQISSTKNFSTSCLSYHLKQCLIFHKPHSGGVGIDRWQIVGFGGGWVVEIFLLMWVGGGIVDFCSRIG